MPEIKESTNDSVRRGVTRRTIVKTAAWSLPVVALAVAVPAATASTSTTPPTGCDALPTGSFTVVGGALVSDGRTGSSPTTDGNFGTGWTPPKAPVWDPQTGLWSQTDQAVAPTPASWWSGGGDPRTDVGFLSLDDNDNRVDAPSHTASVITANYAVELKAGTSYEFELPVYASADFLGPQYLDISASGAGITKPAIVQGYYGNPAIAEVPAGFGAYTHFGSSQLPTVTIKPTSDGIVIFTYTFTLPYVSGGSRQNADLFVQSPSLTTCA